MASWSVLSALVLSTAFATAVTAPPPVQTAAEVSARTARGPFRWQRAARDLGAAMTLGVAWYVSQIEVNKRDFDFDRTPRDQLRRLTSSDGYRFDDNDRFLNVGHSFTGGYYHLVARVHGGSMLQAMVFDLVASSAWELTVEHREVFSLNDTVTTTIGGVALGESLYRIGDLFARSRPTFANRALMTIFSPAHALAWGHGDEPRTSRAGFDERGLAADAHHRFAASFGATTALTSAAATGGWHSSLAADLDVVDLPSYGRAGKLDTRLDGGELTHLGLELTGSRDDLESLAVLARSSLWGRYRQDTAGADIDGHAAFLGSSTAFDLSFHDVGELTDFLMAVHVFGPSADITLHRSPWRLRIGADVYPDFAMVRPFALDSAATRPDDVPGQSTLKHDYYYALGLTAAARAEASYRRLRAGAALEWNGYDAIGALDRHQEAYTSPAGVEHEAIQNDPDMADQRMKIRFFADSPLPLDDVSLGAALDYLRRTGTAREARREHEELRLSFHATYAM
jgi:hypothetical protein